MVANRCRLARNFPRRSAPRSRAICAGRWRVTRRRVTRVSAGLKSASGFCAASTFSKASMDRIKGAQRVGQAVRLIAKTALLAAMLASALMASAARAALEYNLQPPVTPIGEQIFDLHVYIMWICVVIFVGVFAVMFYSIFAHRKSQGPQAPHFR